MPGCCETESTCPRKFERIKIHIHRALQTAQAVIRRNAECICNRWAIVLHGSVWNQVDTLSMRTARELAQMPIWTASIEVSEAGTHRVKRDVHCADRPVALFANDDLRSAPIGRVRVVDLIAIDEQDYVGILLDRT